MSPTAADAGGGADGLAFVIQNQPNRADSDLGRELVGRLACHGSTFSGVGASDQPGAVHNPFENGYKNLSQPPVNPALRRPSTMSGHFFINFQRNPVRWFSIINTIGP